MKRLFSITVIVALLIFGCQSKEDKAVINELKAREEASSQALQELKAREDARARENVAKDMVLHSPSQYIIAGDWDRFDKGLINHYTRITAIRFTNKSAYEIDDIMGAITFTDSNARIMAVVPFTATGMLHVGETLKLPVKSQEITGFAKHASIEIEHIHIRQ